MDDARHWLTVAASILNEPDTECARQLLSLALMRTAHAYVVVRANAHHEVDVFPTRPWRDPALWEEAAQRASTHHPLYAFHAQTRSAQPATLTGVMSQGWALSDYGAGMIDQLGFSLHQLTIPVDAVNPAGASYAMCSEDPYTDQDVARAAVFQPLVVGLDRHIRALMAAGESAHHAPEPHAVRLTPRERIILEQIARGSTADGIAARLVISPRTVHKHQENLYRKLGAVDRLSAVLSAQRLGLVVSPGSDQTVPRLRD